jgi:hypothetical protein
MAASSFRAGITTLTRMAGQDRPDCATHREAELSRECEIIERSGMESPGSCLTSQSQTARRNSMTLQDKLDAMRTAAKTRIPPEAHTIMQRSIDDLRASGILNRIRKVGERAPEFSLPNATGRLVSLQDLLARGPVVLSFYRGRW